VLRLHFYLGEVVERTKNGVDEEEELEREAIGKEERKGHEPDVQILDLVRSHFS